MPLFGRRPKVRLGRHIDDADHVDQFIAAAIEARGAESGAYASTLPPWQRQALEFYDLVGEAWFPAQFYARMLSRVRLHPAVELPNGEYEEVDDEKAQRILARVRDANGGTASWKSQYGRLMFLIGDGYLTASLDRDKRETWEFLSPAELTVGQKDSTGNTTYERKFGNGVPAKEFKSLSAEAELTVDTMRVWRMWRKHPTHSELADSPMRAVVGLLRVLMLLDKAQEAQALSRIVGSGLLIVDDRITIPAPDSDSDDANMEDDPFMSLLTKYVVAPIGNPGSAAQMAPLVARAEAPEGYRVADMAALIQLHDPNQTADWQQRIEKVITRIAIGLDMPPEEFLGLAQANHWTGWVITEEKWKAHGEPVTIQLCNDLTSAYFRQACIDENVENAENMVVWYDPAQVVVHPDRGKDALAVHEAFVLSDDALLRYNNFSDRDKAEPEEIERRAELQGKQRPDDPSEADASDTGSDTKRDAPDNNGPRTDQPSPQPGNQEMRAIIRGAAAVSLERCRELAGSRLLAKRMSAPEAFRVADGVERSLVVSKVGQEVVRLVGITSEKALVKGATEPFLKAIAVYGVENGEGQKIAELIEDHAAETLYDSQVALSYEINEALNALA